MQVTLEELGGEAFDYIDCAGVLHHTPDPDGGLANLATLIHNTPSRVGGVGVMLYRVCTILSFKNIENNAIVHVQPGVMAQSLHSRDWGA